MKLLAVLSICFVLAACGNDSMDGVISTCNEIGRDHEAVRDVDFELDLSKKSALKIDTAAIDGGILSTFCGKTSCVVRSRSAFAIYALNENSGVNYFEGVGKVKIEISNGKTVCAPVFEDEGIEK